MKSRRVGRRFSSEEPAIQAGDPKKLPDLLVDATESEIDLSTLGPHPAGDQLTQPRGIKEADAARIHENPAGTGFDRLVDGLFQATAAATQRERALDVESDCRAALFCHDAHRHRLQAIS